MTRIEVRDFDGDLEALAAMAREAWREAYGAESWPDLHDPSLSRLFLADVPDPRFLLAAYEGSRLVAFLANLPRRYHFQGRAYRGAHACMMIARPSYGGATVYLIAESLRRNREFGADFALLTLERKHRSWHMMKKHLGSRHRILTVRRIYGLARVIDLPRVVAAERLGRFEVLGGKLWGAHRPMRGSPGQVRRYREGDLHHIHQLVRGVSKPSLLVREFSPDSLARHLHTEGVSETVVYEREGVVAGFVTFTVRHMVSPRDRVPWAWVDFLVWEGLNGQEKQALLAGLWEAGRDLGCAGIVGWNMGSYSVGPFLRARFVPYPRLIDLNVWLLNPECSLPGVRGVFELFI
ncbi:MAG: hypothetical protein GXP47_10980 [Acidobacteria bacterium]|nr:hypothetical protein [Acidobacteriota bacterium]